MTRLAFAVQKKWTWNKHGTYTYRAYIDLRSCRDQAAHANWEENSGLHCGEIQVRAKLLLEQETHIFHPFRPRGLMVSVYARQSY